MLEPDSQELKTHMNTREPISFGATQLDRQVLTSDIKS
jgi:hypothetical protein